jgi:glutaredoxin
MILRAFLLGLLVCAASGLAQAQQYRWVDRNGVTQFGDAPPASAKNVQKIPAASGAKPEGPALPFEVARLQNDFPVTLYTTPSCKETCERARALLNKRAVPFSEFQVWNPETSQKMKSAIGTVQIPTLSVGRAVQIGFDPGLFDSLLDTAGYPTAGTYPARNQGAPALPEGYIGPETTAATPPAAAPATRSGPYDPSGLTGPAPKPGQYDPSGLTGPAPRPGQYGVPGESK